MCVCVCVWTSVCVYMCVCVPPLPQTKTNKESYSVIHLSLNPIPASKQASKQERSYSVLEEEESVVRSM